MNALLRFILSLSLLAFAMFMGMIGYGACWLGVVMLDWASAWMDVAAKIGNVEKKGG